jgi:hypothetical protein
MHNLKKQVGAPTVPSAFFRGSKEWEAFRCHKSVTVSYSVTICRVYFIWFFFGFSEKTEKWTCLIC